MPSIITVTTASDANPHSGTSLRDAVHIANLDADSGISDYIVFDPSLVGQPIMLQQGQLELSGNGGGVISILGANSAYGDYYSSTNVVISASNYSSRVFQIDAGVFASFGGLTFENGAAVDGGGILNSGSLQLEDCTISANPGDNGGGIFNSPFATLEVDNSTFSGNGAGGDGGCIANSANATLSVYDSTLAGNRGVGAIWNAGIATVSYSTLAGSTGGAIVNSGTLAVSYCKLTGGLYQIVNGNTISQYEGGGIVNSGTATVNNCTLSGNTSNVDGGGISNSGILTVSDSTIADNSVDGGGGALLNLSDGTVTVTGSTLNDNSASGGGGILNYGTMTLSNSTVAGNSAEAGGGVLNPGTLTVSDSTIAGNSANGPFPFAYAPEPFNYVIYDGGGIRNDGTLTLLSTIVAQNTSNWYSAAADILGNVSGSYNLIGDGTGLSGISNADSNYNQVGIDPKLAPLGNWGGPTQTMPLLPGSPALDAGGPLATLAADFTNNNFTSLTLNNSAAFASTPGTVVVLQIYGEQILASLDSGDVFTVLQRGYNGSPVGAFAANTDVFLAADQRGATRDQSGLAIGSNGTFNFLRDIGAFNVLAPSAIAVTTASDDPSHIGTSLRDAIAQANADANLGGSALVYFDPNLVGQTITLQAGQLELSGGGSSIGTNWSTLSITPVITIDGGANDLSISANDLSRVFQIDPGVQAVINNLTIENGQTIFGVYYYPYTEGAGILNLGTLTLTGSTLSNNTAFEFGGGIDNVGTLTISGSTLSGNSAFDGGGIENDGTLTVSDSTLAGNTASDDGGASGTTVTTC